MTTPASDLRPQTSDPRSLSPVLPAPRSLLPAAPLRILFSGMDWFPEGTGGGLGRYFYEMLEMFSLDGHRGSAIVSSCKPWSAGNITARSMAPKGASLLRRWRGAVAMARQELRGGDIDVVNAHFALYAFPWLRDIPKNVPLVVNFHGPWAEEISAESSNWKRRMVAMIARRMEKTVYRRADLLVTLSSAFREVLIRDYGVSARRIYVVPGGVDTRKYLDAPPLHEARVALGWPADRPIFLAVRRLAKRMGLEMLIEAIRKARVAHPEVLLLIGGKGAEQASLQDLIETHGLGDNVRLLGFIPDEDLPLAYAAADCSVVPTVALEGFGLIIVESLASGTPVLGTPVGAIPEILTGLDENLLFSAVSADALADRMNAVLDGKVVLPGRETCRAYARQYSWPNVMPKLLEIFHQAIEQKAKPDSGSGRAARAATGTRN